MFSKAIIELELRHLMRMNEEGEACETKWNEQRNEAKPNEGERNKVSREAE